jgi:hypothetical protein
MKKQCEEFMEQMEIVKKKLSRGIKTKPVTPPVESFASEMLRLNLEDLKHSADHLQIIKGPNSDLGDKND